ncbi:Ubiquitin-activating enzyme E1 2 [Nymphaea thermarum]|nr:Ubiquitin-activating enzyme E1 2 [Nymphaea thermarum]
MVLKDPFLGSVQGRFGLGLGLGLGVGFFAGVVLLMASGGGYLRSVLHYMLPGKKAGEDDVKTESLLKKPRVDCVIATTNSNSSSHSLETMAGNDRNPAEIDEDLHSRQLAVYGRETMRRLAASNVLISGMQGLGAEVDADDVLFLFFDAIFGKLVIVYEIGQILGNESAGQALILNYFFGTAKNLILAGVKSVTLHDEGLVELWDLSSNFLFSEEDIGKNRALASVQKLQELNNAVVISTLTSRISKDHLSHFQASYPSSLGNLNLFFL